MQSGDTLGAIARKYGTTVNKLCELNGYYSQNGIKVRS
ncbi:MAG: LysM peptidoglycan-binding domain-containing protein [Tannerellaceae bacterium]|nr:LysM peptidoglycan-binding domain-containing protein [Tannerellaceae bacterium]